MSAHDDIKTQLAAYEAEHEKFEKGNSAAGTRARKALAEMAKAIKARRTKSLRPKLLVKKQRLEYNIGRLILPYYYDNNIHFTY